MTKKNEKNWRCLHCEKTYKTSSQICPKCHRVMVLETNSNKKSGIMLG